MAHPKSGSQDTARRARYVPPKAPKGKDAKGADAKGADAKGAKGKDTERAPAGCALRGWNTRRTFTAWSLQMRLHSLARNI